VLGGPSRLCERRGCGGDDDGGDGELCSSGGGGGDGRTRRGQARRTRERNAAVVVVVVRPESFFFFFSRCLRSGRVDVPGVPGGRREAAAGAVEAGAREREEGKRVKN
jgi:hypothetical protein